MNEMEDGESEAAATEKIYWTQQFCTMCPADRLHINGYFCWSFGCLFNYNKLLPNKMSGIRLKVINNNIINPLRTRYSVLVGATVVSVV